MKTVFLTGIHTDAGKTVASAIVCKALKADYWKPIQSGYPEDSDTRTVKTLVGETEIAFHPESYTLKAPLSPHTAADQEGIRIDLNKVVRPRANRLLIEGAGGLLVPLNEKDTIVNLLKPEDRVILVSRHYLGSINHTLLSVALLNNLGFKPGIIFVGNPNPSTEDAILSLGDCEHIGRIEETDQVDANFVATQSVLLQKKLEEWLEE
ncbi:MAG: dethiobiotin synthase [Bacteroidetes bacterium]|nr:MAG: dethiobiotin synthase [Bacteroidota bacterium]